LLVIEGKSERVTREEALARARDAELDLVELNPKSNPPVCKILDSGSHLYRLEKKERKQRRAVKQTSLKTVRIGFRTDQHDLDRQLGRAREFLAERRLVKVDLRMRGRELLNEEYAREKIAKFVEALMTVAEIEKELKKQGNRLSVTLKPKK
jgi:translation initiation factor IF-3